MTRFRRYHLSPRGAFHFGSHGIEAEESVERCHSDTLYAALLAESQRGGPAFFAPTAEQPDGPPNDPPLLLSSCFPFVGEVPLLPLPRLRLPLPDGEGQRKRFKHLAYVSPTIFRLIVAGEEGSLDAYLPQTDEQAGKGKLLMGDSIWVANDDGALPDQESTTFWKVETVPHVTVDRVRESSAFYQVGQVYFAPGCGLYLLCQERQPGAADALFDLLGRLGDSGLGGRRSRGLGQFVPSEAAPLDLDLGEGGERLVLLSRYRPSQDELRAGVLGDGASYEVVRVGGWLQTPADAPAQRRRSVRLLREGSVIRVPPDGTLPIGTVCDVRPTRTEQPIPHPVWRYGLALGVPIGGGA